MHITNLYTQFYSSISEIPLLIYMKGWYGSSPEYTSDINFIYKSIIFLRRIFRVFGRG